MEENSGKKIVQPTGVMKRKVQGTNYEEAFTR